MCPDLSLGIDRLLFWVIPCDPQNRLATGEVSGCMGDWGAVCAILISAWVTSWGAQLGDRGGGGGSVMVILLEFFLCREFFFREERPGRREK